MKLLITGGLGFLGSHLVDKLFEKGTEVTIVDNLSSNVLPPEAYRDKCNVVECDLKEYKPDQEYDYIFHVASVVGPAGVLPYAGRLGYNIVNEHMTVIDWALQFGSRLLLISTSEVYGRDGVFSESADMVVSHEYSVRMEYGVGKLLAEITCMNTAKANDLWVNIIRPFNIVGPRQSSRGGFVLPRFIEAALNGNDITVFGNGTQIRAFSHVHDIVSGIMSIAFSDVRGEIFNVGNPNNVTSINRLAELVRNLTGSASRIVHVNPKDIYGPLYEEAFDKIPNITKITEMFDWYPKWGLIETIEDTIRYFTSQSSIPKSLMMPAIIPK